MNSELFTSAFGPNAGVVVFGGSGFIGTHLLKRLVSENVSRIVSVDIKQPDNPVKGVDYVIGDIRNLSGLEVGIDHPVIFNLAAVHTTPGHEPWEYYDANVNGALEVTRFARKYNAKAMVFTSSISVYGPGESEKDENSVPNPESDYGRSKLIAERIHCEWASEDDRRTLVVVRPAVVFGLGEGGNFTRLSRVLGKGFFLYPGRTDTIKSCIYVKDLLTWIFIALSKGERKILFNACYKDRYTIEDIVQAFRRIAFPKLVTYTIPSGVLRFVASVLKPVSSATGLGIHPDRIAKLMVSTNIFPSWAVKNGLQAEGRLDRSLKDWYSDGENTFE